MSRIHREQKLFYSAHLHWKPELETAPNYILEDIQYTITGEAAFAKKEDSTEGWKGGIDEGGKQTENGMNRTRTELLTYLHPQHN